MENFHGRPSFPERPPEGEQFDVFEPLIEEAYEVIDNIFVTTPDGQVFPWAADDENYRYAVFTSDACKILQFLYEAKSDPRALEILRTKGPAILKTICAEQYLSSQQPKVWKDPLHYRDKRKKERLANAEPGQFPHEQRKREYAPGVVADGAALSRLENLAPARGGTKDKMIDYGRIDSVALVLNTYGMLHAVLQDQPDNELYTPFMHATGVLRTLDEAMLDAGTWMMRRFKESDVGLIETLRAFPGDTRNKSWKDALTALLHDDGSLPNTDREVAAIEVQSEYDQALVNYAGLLNKLGRTQEANECHWLRIKLESQIVSLFWARGDEAAEGVQKEDHFVVAIDRDKNGKPRHIKIPGGTSLSFNKYGIFGGDIMYPYAVASLRAAYEKENLSSIGERSRSASYRHYPGFVDIQGSYAVWMSENADIGLSQYHMKAYTAFAELAVRALAGMYVSGKMREFNLCDEKDRLLVPQEDFPGDIPPVVLPAEAYAQRRQGFAAAGVIVLYTLLKKIGPDLAHDYMQRRSGDRIWSVWEERPWWVEEREREILAEIPSYRFRPEDLIAAIRRTMLPYLKQQIEMTSTYEPKLVPAH